MLVGRLCSFCNGPFLGDIRSFSGRYIFHTKWPAKGRNWVGVVRTCQFFFLEGKNKNTTPCDLIKIATWGKNPENHHRLVCLCRLACKVADVSLNYTFSETKPQNGTYRSKYWFPGFGFDSGSNLQPWHGIFFLFPGRCLRSFWSEVSLEDSGGSI